MPMTSPMRTGLTLAGFIAFAIVGAYYMVTEHRQHLADYLPYLLLMACPLMHLFGHGHGGQHHGGGREEGRKP